MAENEVRLPTNDELLILSNCALALGIPRMDDSGRTHGTSKIHAPIGLMAQEILRLQSALTAERERVVGLVTKWIRTFDAEHVLITAIMDGRTAT